MVRTATVTTPPPSRTRPPRRARPRRSGARRVRRTTRPTARRRAARPGRAAHPSRPSGQRSCTTTGQPAPGQHPGRRALLVVRALLRDDHGRPAGRRDLGEGVLARVGDDHVGVAQCRRRVVHPRPRGPPEHLPVPAGRGRPGLLERLGRGAAATRAVEHDHTSYAVVAPTPGQLVATEARQRRPGSAAGPAPAGASPRTMPRADSGQNDTSSLESPNPARWGASPRSPGRTTDTTGTPCRRASIATSHRDVRDQHRRPVLGDPRRHGRHPAPQAVVVEGRPVQLPPRGGLDADPGRRRRAPAAPTPPSTPRVGAARRARRPGRRHAAASTSARWR